MSWKPCRGGRIGLDKAIKNSHECFFQFRESESIKDKSKIAFKWYKADEYLGNAGRLLNFFGDHFINQCKQSKDTYKPFLNLINNLQQNNKL